LKYSVVIPTYNRAGFLKKAMDSVLGQSFGDFELIIVDDGSGDSTSALIEKCEDNRVRYFYQQNRGPASARNAGLKKERGEYIAFLDSDDWWLQNKLERSRGAIERYPEYSVFHTQEKWFRNGRVLNQKKIHAKPSGYIFEECLRLCCVSMSTAVLKREVFETVGFFDEDLPVCEDYDFWLRVSVKYPVCLIDEVLTEKEGGHPDQVSKRFPAMDRFRIKSIANLIESGALDEGKREKALQALQRKYRIYANGCLKRGKLSEGKAYLKLMGAVTDGKSKSESEGKTVPI
jgi:glycosyltransferase involved in cell wall biosynthesis